MIDEIREGGGCLQLVLTAIVLSFVLWFVISLFLMAAGQIVDVAP